MRHEFVEYAPERLEDGVLYVSIRFSSAMHKCACGCGTEVATPLSPTGWEIRFDGETVSLFPSIGNWELPCRSHYWIWRGRVEWARAWSPAEVAHHRTKERRTREQFHRERGYEADQERSTPATDAAPPAIRVEEAPEERDETLDERDPTDAE